MTEGGRRAGSCGSRSDATGAPPDPTSSEDGGGAGAGSTGPSERRPLEPPKELPLEPPKEPSAADAKLIVAQQEPFWTSGSRPVTFQATDWKAHCYGSIWLRRCHPSSKTVHRGGCHLGTSVIRAYRAQGGGLLTCPFVGYSHSSKHRHSLEDDRRGPRSHPRSAALQRRCLAGAE